MHNTVIEPGIYFGLSEAEYFAAEGLSNSGIKQLAVSPLWYWHNNLNQDFAAPEESYSQRIGKAVHCRLLEPSRFAERYTVKPLIADYPGALVTVDDMKEWLAGVGLPTAHKRKQDLIDRIEVSGLNHPPIWEQTITKLMEENVGKVVLDRPEADGIEKLAAAVGAEPVAKTLFTEGMPEVSFFVRDPVTGVTLKARMDYVRPNLTADLKTFSNSRGKPTDRVVFDAIYHEGYYVQCAFYHRVRELARQQLAAGEIATHGTVSEEWLKGFTDSPRPHFAFLFVESAAPFDLRVVALRRQEAPGADANVYWSAAEMKIADSIELYAECAARYGDAPWRPPAHVHILSDTDLPQLMFAYWPSRKWPSTGLRPIGSLSA